MQLLAPPASLFYSPRPLLAGLLAFLLAACGRPDRRSDDSGGGPPPSGLSEVSVRVTVPDAGWEVKIERISRVGDELWVVSQLNRPESFAAQVISQAQDTVRASLPDLPRRHLILGKTWGWENEEPYTFLQPGDPLPAELERGELLHDFR